MPDADDFDVEYFRDLLKGNSGKEGPAPPAGPSQPPAKKAPALGTPASSKKEGKPFGRKKKKNC